MNDGHPEEHQIGDIPREFGRYRVLRSLGEGGMGVVYLAEDTALERMVALKTPRHELLKNSKIVRRFIREAKAAARLRHPNICPIFDIGNIEGRYYLTMAFLEGESLATHIDRDQRLEPALALRIVSQLAGAIDEMHIAKIIHRDLKPNNVMMVGEAEPVIIDFGIARRLDTSSMETSTSSVIGTVLYTAPELISGEYPVTKSVDVYSLGVILYILLSGQAPFSGNLATMMGSVVSDQPPPPSWDCEHLPPVVDQLCLRAIAKNPSDRYESAGHFAKAIEACLTEL